jgi:hypothetical protein
MNSRRRQPLRPVSLLGLATLVALGGVLAACDARIATSTPRPSRLVATPEPRPDPTPSQLDEAPTLRPEPTGVGPSLVEAANALADLGSYRVEVASRGLVPATTVNGQVSMTSTLIQRDAPSAQFSMAGVAGFAGGRLQAIVIGDQAWLKEGSGGWQKSPGGAADFDAAFTTLSPIDLVSDFDGLSGALGKVGEERKNGQRAAHYRSEDGDAEAVAAGLSRGTTDLWVAIDDGHLVSLAIEGTWDVDGTATPITLAIDVSHVDDPTNRVVAP